MLKFESIGQRLAEFGQLPDNWNSYGAKPFDNADLEWIQSVIEEMIVDLELPIPYLYPTADSNVQMEWTFRSSKHHWEVSAEINLKTHEAYLHSCDLAPSDGLSFEVLLNLNLESARWNFRHFVMGFKDDQTP